MRWFVRPTFPLASLLSGFFFLSGFSVHARAEAFDVDLDAKQIEYFKNGDSKKTFGKLEFVGGLEFTSSNQHVGAISGIALIDGRKQIVAITDTGFWFSARIKRDKDGKPVALEHGRMAPLLDGNGVVFPDKASADAESIIISKDEALVSFERNHRVLKYKLDLENFASLPKRVPLNINTETLRRNKGLETIVVAPAASALAGAVLVVSERSYAAKRQIRGAILDGPMKGHFTVQRKKKFDITDGDFLPDGDLVLLERSFNMANGVAMRLRRIKAGKIRPGANLKGKALLSADVSYQIDNMEGLSITTGKDGQVYLSLISDNNHSLLQRNLYLEFRLVQ